MFGFFSSLISTSTAVTRYIFLSRDVLLPFINRNLKIPEKAPYPILKGYKHEDAPRKTPLYVKTPYPDRIVVINLKRYKGWHPFG